MRRENGRTMASPPSGYRRRMGGGFKRYGLYHKTQGVPDDWALNDRPGKKQIFGLVCAHRSKGRNFAFFGSSHAPTSGTPCVLWYKPYR